MITNEAIEAAAMGIMGVRLDGWEWYAEPVREEARAQAKRALEAAAAHMQPDRKSLAGVLSAHQIETGNRGMKPRCTCGWLGQVFGNDFRKDFITHQSDMLTVALRTVA